MTSYLELAFAWLLFLSMPALATGMFYRAWKSGSSRSATDKTAARSGTTFPPASGYRWSYFAAINATCGLGLYAVFAAVLLVGPSFATWSSLAALVVWLYCLSLHILKRKNASRFQQA